MPERAGPTTPAVPPRLWGVFALSLTLNLWGIWFGLPDSWHPDELVRGSAAMAREFTLQPPWYLYGSMHYYLLLAVMTPTYLVAELVGLPPETQKTLVYLAARALSAVLGAGCVVLTYLVAQTLFNRTAALIAALLLATSVGLVNISHFATVDVPMLFWMMAAYFMSARVLNGAGVREHLLAGAFAGMAAGMKYVGGVALLALVAAYGLRQCERRARYLLVGVVAAGGAFLLVNLPTLFNSCAFFEGIIMDNAFNTVVGAGSGEAGEVLVLRGILDALGMPVFFLVLLALIYAAVGVLRKQDIRQNLFLASTLLPFFLTISNIHYASIRHVLPMVPPLLILVGKMFADLIGRSAARGVRHWLGYGMLALAIISSAVYTLSAELQFTFDGRDLATAWIMGHAAPGATIEVTSYGPRIPDERFVVEKRPPLPNIEAALADLRDAAVYRALHPVYLRYKSGAEALGLCEPRARHYVGWYERAKAYIARQLATFDPTMAGLHARGPDLLVVSSLDYDHFLNDAASPDGRFFEQLFENGGRYRQVAELHYELLPWLDPELEFINPTVRIYQKQPAEP